MFKLRENEKILIAVHRHWWTLARTVILVIFLLLVPPIVLSLLPLLGQLLDLEIVKPIVNFFLALYSLALLLALFLFWMDYYLDMWIVTSERIIDIEQRGLFNREISEIPMERVQDVTLEIKGILETFLKFGTIKVQTAGEREFVMSAAYKPYAVKNAILDTVKNIKRDHL